MTPLSSEVPHANDDEPAKEAVLQEGGAEPGEEWIEEYEAERRDGRPRREIPHPAALVFITLVLIILVAWVLIAPQVLPVAGTAYLDTEAYANLGSYSGDLDIWWLFDRVHVAETTWGVSVSGDRNVSSGQPATFMVLVTKVSEEMKNPWFVGTSVRLRDASLHIDGGPEVGSMASKTDERFGPLAVVEAVFDTPGSYECVVHVEVTIYGNGHIGYFPVKVLRLSVDLDVPVNVT